MFGESYVVAGYISIITLLFPSFFRTSYNYSLLDASLVDSERQFAEIGEFRKRGRVGFRVLVEFLKNPHTILCPLTSFFSKGPILIQVLDLWLGYDESGSIRVYSIPLISVFLKTNEAELVQSLLIIISPTVGDN